MSVFKRNATWKAEVYFQGKRLVTKSGFPSKSSAKKWHDSELGKASLGLLDKKKERVSFETLLEAFVASHLPTVRAGTAQRYEIDLKLRIIPYFQFRDLSRCDSGVIAAFRAEILNDLSIKSANNCLALLKCMFSKGVEWGLIEKNPSMNVKLLKLPKQKYQWWERKEDIIAFLDTTKGDRYEVAYRLALETGMRLGEIVGLSKGDIDLGRGQIQIHQQWLDKKRCYGPTKSGETRYVAFETDSHLAALLEQAVQNSPHPEAILWTKTGARLGARKLSGYHFQRLIERSGVPRIRFHDLRHTFASWFMISQDDIWTLKAILGHADIQTTQRYAHLSSRFQKPPKLLWN